MVTEIEKTESLAQALSLLQMRLPRIEKSQTAKVETKTGGSYSYSYADLSNISAQLLPMLGALGLSFLARPTFSEGRFVLAYELLHVTGESKAGEYPLPTGGTPQALGSAITYGRRYCLCAVTGVAPEDDDDASVAQAEASGQRGTAQRSSRPAAKSAARTAAPEGKTAQRAASPAGPPPLPSETDAITGPQLAKLHILMAKEGYDASSRQEGLAYLSAKVGRDIVTSKELTKREAMRIIDDLELPEGPPDGES
jgi:hypothetical protein